MGMICTRCYQKTPYEVDAEILRKLPHKVIIDLCENWRCNDCLEEVEADTAKTENRPQSTTQPLP